MLRIENAREIRAPLAAVDHFEQQHSGCIAIDVDFDRFARGTATNSPRDKVEKRLSQLALIGNDGRDLGSQLILDLDLLLLGHTRCCCTRLAQRLSDRELL